MSTSRQNRSNIAWIDPGRVIGEIERFLWNAADDSPTDSPSRWCTSRAQEILTGRSADAREVFKESVSCRV